MPGRGASYTPREQELVDLIVSKKPDRVSIESATRHAKFIIALQRKMKLNKQRNVTWLKTRMKDISTFVEQNYNRGSIVSNFNHLAVVSYWFNLEKQAKHYQEMEQKYSKIQKAEYAKQQPTTVQKTNWIPLDRLKQRYEEHWLPMFTAMEDKRTLDEADRRILQLVLAAHINIMEPPCRSVYAAVRVTPRLPKIGDIGHGKPNLLYIPSRGNQATLYVNTDKVSNTDPEHGGKPGNLGADHWKLRADTTELIKKTLKLWNRTYVMSERVMSLTDYGEIVRTALSFGGRVVGTRLIRNIHVSNFYETNSSPAMTKKLDLARKMRHSTETAEIVYRKLKMDGEIIMENSDDEVEEQTTCPGVLVMKQTTSARRQRRYYLAHADDIRERARERWREQGLHYRQQRSIALLQAGALKMRESTLEKLGIECQNGHWIATKNLRA